MKILKQGDPEKSKKPWYYQNVLTCRNCGAEFMLDRGDEVVVGKLASTIVTGCPCCFMSCRFSYAESDLPPGEPRPL